MSVFYVGDFRLYRYMDLYLYYDYLYSILNKKVLKTTHVAKHVRSKDVPYFKFDILR